MQIKKFKEIPRYDWPVTGFRQPDKVFLSTQFLAQLYYEKSNVTRISICRTKRKGTKWADSITWDEIQQIKNLIGFKNRWAVEVFPSNDSLVNVSNMRHIFVLNEKPEFAWSKDEKPA